MSRWHPVLGTPDPAAAWFGPEQLAELRRIEQVERAIAHRDRFEDAVRLVDNPTPEEIKALWHQGDPDHVTD